MNAMNKNLWQAVKFTLFSISAGIIQVLSFALLHDVLGLESYWMSHVPSLVLSVIWNFTFNRRYTFRSDAPLVRSMLLVALFYVVFTPASAWWGTLLERAGVHAWLIEAINLLANFVLEFLYQRFIVYRGHIDTNDIARGAA
ncbi:MAG: GtrA family protein [Eubacteriales bacterium]|nr:GtrA family protein [Eubacteriales bacterium]